MRQPGYETLPHRLLDVSTIKAVLFDYGLTLVTFEYPRRELLAVLNRFRPEIGQALGRPAPVAEEIVTQVLEPLEDELERLGEDEVSDYLDFYGRAWSRAGMQLGRELLFQILDEEQRVWDRSVRIAPGAFEVLDELRRRGLRTAVVSNAPFPPLLMRRQMSGNGIAARVDAVVLSAEVGKRKPAPELYLAALAALGVEPASALYVGDRRREDYEGPKRAGLQAVLCTQLARSQPPAGVPTIRNLQDLLQLF